MRKTDIQAVQRHVARVAVGASTARGCPKYTVKKAREFLSGTQLADFSAATDQSAFDIILNAHTKRMRAHLPTGVGWGHRRKFINIFLRDAAYNRFLCHAYGLSYIEKWLEVPLDGNVGGKIYANRGENKLTPWDTIRDLKSQKSRKYQDVAQTISDAKKVYRVDLDLEYW